MHNLSIYRIYDFLVFSCSHICFCKSYRRPCFMLLNMLLLEAPPQYLFSSCLLPPAMLPSFLRNFHAFMRLVIVSWTGNFWNGGHMTGETPFLPFLLFLFLLLLLLFLLPSPKYRSRGIAGHFFCGARTHRFSWRAFSSYIFSKHHFLLSFVLFFCHFLSLCSFHC